MQAIAIKQKIQTEEEIQDSQQEESLNYGRKASKQEKTCTHNFLYADYQVCR